MSKLLNVALALLVIGLLASYLYRMPKYSEADQAPDFTAQMLNGGEFTLSDLQGKYVLLDFWGSWCGPCRRENPALVQLHAQHGGKNFEIVSVAIERSEKSLRNAIKKDNLGWEYHIPQLQRFKSPVAQLYGVREIPTKYLISPEGAIIGVNPSVSEINHMLTQQS